MKVSNKLSLSFLFDFYLLHFLFFSHSIVFFSKLYIFFLSILDGKSLCELHVDGQVLPLYPGHCLIFDDSFLHEAFNFSQSEPRLALIFDIWHPDLSPEEVNLYLSYYFLFTIIIIYFID